MTQPDTSLSASERLVAALKEAKAPNHMIELAEEGHYGDFSSKLATPITQLVIDAEFWGLDDIAKRAMKGAFDGR